MCFSFLDGLKLVLIKCIEPRALCCMLFFLDGLKPVPTKCIEPTALCLNIPKGNDIGLKSSIYDFYERNQRAKARTGEANQISCSSFVIALLRASQLLAMTVGLNRP